MIKKIKNKLKNKSGSVSIETAIIIITIFPLALGLLIGGYLYFLAQAQNVNINFDTGRYMSTNGCNVSTASTLNALEEWRGYNIDVTYEKFNETTHKMDVISVNNVKNDAGGMGKIIIHCPIDAKRGDEFTVETNKTIIKGYGGNLFPNEINLVKYYVEEAN